MNRRNFLKTSSLMIAASVAASAVPVILTGKQIDQAYRLDPEDRSLFLVLKEIDRKYPRLSLVRVSMWNKENEKRGAIYERLKDEGDHKRYNWTKRLYNASRMTILGLRTSDLNLPKRPKDAPVEQLVPPFSAIQWEILVKQDGVMHRHYGRNFDL